MCLAFSLYALFGAVSISVALASVSASIVTLNSTDPTLYFASSWQTALSQTTGRSFLFNDEIGTVLTVDLPGELALMPYVVSIEHIY